MIILPCCLEERSNKVGLINKLKSEFNSKSNIDWFELELKSNLQLVKIH